MTDINHNHGNDTGNGNQSNHGSDEGARAEDKPDPFYGKEVHHLRVLDVSEGVRIVAIPCENWGDRGRSQITIPHSLLPDDYPWRGRR